MSPLPPVDADKLLETAVNLGIANLKEDGGQEYSTGDVTEQFLVGLLREAAIIHDIDPVRIVHHSGHAFPDVSVEGTTIGIELKGSISSRKFNGNSVFASTMLPRVKKIYLFYWIKSPPEIGYRDYFSCVKSPVVTHSPRFHLDIDLDSADSMFGVGRGKVGCTSEVIFSDDGIATKRIINWMVNDARSRGEVPWWIPDREELIEGTTGLRKTHMLSTLEKERLFKALFLTFPSILGPKSPNKYTNIFEWAVTFKSVWLTRDSFSAGGQIKIRLPVGNGVEIQAPKVIERARQALTSTQIIFLSELNMAIGLAFSKSEEFMTYYRQKLSSNLAHIYKSLPEPIKNHINASDFSEALVDYVLQDFDEATLKST